MAITATKKHSRPYTVIGDDKLTVTDILFDSSYPTGGEAITAANLNLTTIDVAWVGGISIGTQTVNVASANVDLANSKIQLFDETPAEVASTADVSGTTVRVVAIGR